MGCTKEHQEKLRPYCDMVEETVDLDDPSHACVLRADLDVDLARCRKELENVRDQLDDEHRRVGKDLGVDIEKKLHLENHQVYKYSFRITKAVRETPSHKRAWTTTWLS